MTPAELLQNSAEGCLMNLKGACCELLAAMDAIEAKYNIPVGTQRGTEEFDEARARLARLSGYRPALRTGVYR